MLRQVLGCVAANKAQALPLVLLFHVALFKNVRTPSPPQNKEIQLFTEEKYKFLFSIRSFGVLVYKIRFPLLRAAGNRSFHCNSTQSLCGVGFSPCWRSSSPPWPGRGHTCTPGVCSTAPPQPLLCPSGLKLPGEAGKPLGSCWEAANGAG